MSDFEHAAVTLRLPPRIEYVRLAPGADAAPLPPDTLAAIVFGRDVRPRFGTRSASPDPRASDTPPTAPDALAPAPSASPDPRLIRVSLDSLGPSGIVELWRATGPVQVGRDGPIRFAADADHLAGVIELDERDHGGLTAAAEWAYAAIRRFHSRGAHPHLLRMWNYFDGINRGAGDAERYRQFCLGRAAGLGPLPPSRFPAATAIGRRDDSATLQVYWLAARAAGTPLENPRQVSAYRYPRRYGPAAPTFSRAMLVSRRLLMISGTASVVGHASRHPDSLSDQLDETLINLTSVLERAAAMQPAIPHGWGAHTLLKMYLRDGALADRAAAHLSARLPPEVQVLMLEADICRTDLLVEIDCAHGS